MNHLERQELLADVGREPRMPCGHFGAVFSHGAKAPEQARFAAAPTAADRFHSRPTMREFELRELEEQQFLGRENP